METVNWKVGGMTCSNCALTIGKYLEKEGLQNINVSPITGEVQFDMNDNPGKEQVIRGIESLGYTVQQPGQASSGRPGLLSSHLQRFLFCLVFTLPLLLHMVDKWLHIPLLMNPWMQFTLCVPVYTVGMNFFGRSAWHSIRNGIPNMNVLIALGATAAFIYSVSGMLLHLGEHYLFFETAAAIITLVFLGNYVEERTIQLTQKALNELAGSQKIMANMIAFDAEHQEHVFPVEQAHLKSGDIILIKSGEPVPADCKILWGDASVNQALITGESLPVEKHAKDLLIGGSMLTGGTVKAQVTAAGKDTVLSGIIDLVKQAQAEKPPLQQLADRISAVFVPIVLVIAVLTFVINYFLLHDLTVAIMRGIAVLVIACPCAMGLATPAAIAVGLGRAARSGILFRHARSLAVFRNIQQVVFDKTGTLTSGRFTIQRLWINAGGPSEPEFKNIVYSLEKYSNHPIARSIAGLWKTKQPLSWKKMEEIKGFGMRAETNEGDAYQAGSWQLAASATNDRTHSVYVLKNDGLVGWIDVEDEVRPEAKAVIHYFKKRSVKTILLSGDTLERCNALAITLGIDEVIAGQSPVQKLETMDRLSALGPTAMIGDGINDAPALAKASIGFSMSDASHIAMQTADVVLMNNGIKNLPMAMGLGNHTFITIRQNLFWAFIYNLVAIPVAGFGLLSPAIAALAMGLSDVVLAINSVRLFIKKVD